MLRLAPGVRIIVATKPVHSNAGVDRLVQIVRDRFGEDPFSGNLFCFFNRSRDQVKILMWDRNGFWLMCKRIERGRFENVDLRVQGVEVDRAVFAMLLEGFDTRTRRYRKHFGRDLRIRERVDDHGSECTA